MKKLFVILITLGLILFNSIGLFIFCIYTNIEGFAISKYGDFVVDISNVLYFYNSNNTIITTIPFIEGVTINQYRDSSETFTIEMQRSGDTVEYDYKGNELRRAENEHYIIYPFNIKHASNGDYYIKYSNILGYESLKIGNYDTLIEQELDICSSFFFDKLFKFLFFFVPINIIGIVSYVMIFFMTKYRKINN